MRAGFTGTRRGMSPAQLRQLRKFLSWVGVMMDEFHHGAAEGADTEADILLKHLKLASPNLFAGVTIVPHPAGKDPLKRDREIVALVDLLIAAPAGDKEELRSGTWATVRYARAAGLPVVMLSRGSAPAVKK